MDRVFTISSTLILALLVNGCGGDEGRATDTSIFGDDEGIDSGNSSSSSSGDGDTLESSTGTKLDTLFEETTATAEGGEAQGCAAIDFLFVIDNSGSMGDNQQALIASFPGFIQKIQETIADVDSYHVMVVDTDEYWNDCTVECAFPFPVCTFDGVNGCDGAPSVCDETLGGGVTFPLGSDASNQYCNLTGGQRFITSLFHDAATPEKFTCIASVGTDGDSNERPLQAMTAAISPALNGPGGCNTGFLRDDAVLVLTIITDEEDNSSGTPNGLYQNIVAQKGGHPENVVVVGLINDLDQPAPICPPEAGEAPRLYEFMNYFPNSLRGSVCDLNYSTVFEQAVDLINTTCEEYVPIG